jgi:hypothetical protein
VTLSQELANACCGLKLCHNTAPLGLRERAAVPSELLPKALLGLTGRAPVMVLGGTGPMDMTRRRPWIDWIHTALVQGNLVRDYTKFDDQPHSLAAVPESMMRA